MNGRIYDPELGRFLSADPNIQSPLNSQSHNRYSYVWNNPLKYTDPSGFFLKKLFKKVKKFFKKWGRAIVAIAAAAFTAGASLYMMTGFWTVGAAAAAGISVSVGTLMAVGAAAGFVSGAIMTGTLKGAVKGAIFGGISAGIARGISLQGFDPTVADVLHGVAQGTLSEAFGGDFKSGFIGAAVGNSVGGKLREVMPNTVIGKTIAAAVTGGIVSKLGGGKFANGARSMAFIHLLKEAPGFYRRTVRYGLDASPGGSSEDKGELGMPVSGANNVGVQRKWRFDSNGQRIIGFFEEGGPVSRFFNRIWTVNAVAGMHDVQQISMGKGIWRNVMNVPGMAVAAGVTYAGFVGQAISYAPDCLYLQAANGVRVSSI
jgi:hypothetical protein